MIDCDDGNPVSSMETPGGVVVSEMLTADSSFVAKPKSKKARSRKKVVSISSPDVNPWHNIFAQSKLVVSIETRNPGNSQIMIHFAQDDFFENFGFTRADLPMPLCKLYGDATIRYNAHRLQNAILMGKETCEYQNLYKANGCALSCHIACISLVGGRSNPPSVQLLESNELEDKSIKWSILTLRSASVVGNTMHSGIGILGLEAVPPDILHSQFSFSNTTSDGSKSNQKKNCRTTSTTSKSKDFRK